MIDDLLTVLVTAVFHDQDNLQKEAFDWGLTMASKGQSIVIMAGNLATVRYSAVSIALKITFDLQNAVRDRVKLSLGWTFETSKHPQATYPFHHSYTYFNKVTPPSPSQTILLTRDQTFKFMNQWGDFSFEV